MKIISENSRDVGLYYKVVSALKTREAPQKWDIRFLFPGKSDEEIGLLVRDYFNTISSEFAPVSEDDIPRGVEENFQPLERHQVAAILRSCKKPRSCVRGDILPKLVTLFADILAIPLPDLYNQAILTREWPDLWKRETITVIPKCAVLASLSECRNIACTPLFSKVLESIVLKRLKEETNFAGSQYGGLRGCGADHFLVKTWDQIMESLEDNRACASLISIDFEKAFNRMNHSECLKALEDHGAGQISLSMAGAFLTGENAGEGGRHLLRTCHHQRW